MAKAKFRHRETYKGEKIDLTAATERELAEKVRARKNDIDGGINADKENITVDMWASEWLTVHKKPDLSLPVYKNYCNMVEAYISPTIGSKKIKSITSTDIKHMINEDPNGDWHKIKLRNVASGMFKQAVQDRIISFNPCESVTAAKTPPTSLRALSDEERQILLDVAAESPYGLWIETLLYTGIRPQESAALLWRDLDHSTHSIRINKALKAKGDIGDTKSEASNRTVPLPSHLWDKLIKNQGARHEYVFVTQIGQNGKGNLPLNHQSMKRHWESFHREMMIRAGAKLYRNRVTEENPNPLVESIRDITLYSLRHTYATDLCRAGVHMRSAVALMGHQDSKMLIKIYSDFTQDQANEARDQLTKFYSKVGTCAGT